MTYVGRWDPWYVGAEREDPQAYGDVTTYQRGADWLKACDRVEDWGCGKGFLSTLIPEGRYRGIDGACTPWADEVVDLRSYINETPGLFMRHVLEHNYDWKSVLANALASYTERMALITFTPFGEVTTEIGYTDRLDVPDLSFGWDEFTSLLAGHSWSHERVTTSTQYDVEDIFYLERRTAC